MQANRADSGEGLRVGGAASVATHPIHVSPHAHSRPPLRLSSASRELLLTVGRGLTLAALVCLLPGGCGEEGGYPAAPGRLDVRDVRVLLFDAQEGCRIRVDGPYKLRSSSGQELSAGGRMSWTEVHAGSGVRLGGMAPVEGALTVEAARYGTIRVAARRDGEFLPGAQYAGSLVLSVRPDGGVRAVNVVDVESYVAGVVPNEAWPGFHYESLKGQAIAARSYVLYIMSRRADRPFDLRAGEGDQVYRGMRLDSFARRTRRAVDDTRGVVLCWPTPVGDRAFCTYYSAACGGMSQSLADVQPGASVPDPLRGGVRCDYCRIAKGNAYRWGPAEIAKKDLLERMRTRRRECAAWKVIDSVIVSRMTMAGRVAEVTVIGDSEQRVVMVGEHFRLAVGSRVMRSTDCVVVDSGDRVRFTSGRGFGHGLGLCQWGMEGQARAGKAAGEILRYYYPGSKLVRAY